MRKEQLVERIEHFIFSQDDIAYQTVRWGWCVDTTRVEKYCKSFREEGVNLTFTCDRGNAEYPSRNFKFGITAYNEGMIERAERVIRRIQAAKTV